VQTSVFMVWALAGAHLHLLRRYRADGAYGRLHPLLGLLTGVAALLSLSVTRSPMLASSHRYVGETSMPWLLAAAAALAAVTVVAFALSFRRSVAPGRGNESAWLIATASTTLMLCALVAAWHIADAYLAAWRGLPRPDSMKPFFAFLARWVSSREAEELARLFNQWDVDRFTMNAWLAPIALIIALAGGHNFLPVRRRASRWSVTAGVAALAVVAPVWIGPSARFYAGQGMTSANTTKIFPWLDALAVAASYFALSALAWGLVAAWRHGRHGVVGRYYLPVGSLHFGLMLALAAATIASVFDVYAKRDLRYPGDFEKPIAFPWNYEVTVAIDHERLLKDGRRNPLAPGSFVAVAEVAWRLSRPGQAVESERGQAIYRDQSPPAPGGLGPVRLMCEILDYRYARTVSGANQIIDPFIHRGLWRDVQVWLPAIEYRLADGAPGALADLRAPSTVPVVLKIYPMMTWMWLGLVVALLGAGVVMGYEWRALRRNTATSSTSADQTN